MNDLENAVYEQYEIKISIEKIKDYLYTFLYNESSYYIKFTNSNKEEIFQYLWQIQYPYFEKIIVNKNGCFCSKYKNYYFYISKHIENMNDTSPYSNKFYIQAISMLNNMTMKSSKVEKTFYTKLIQSLKDLVYSRKSFYDHYIISCERNRYRRPEEWYFMMNYMHIDRMINSFILHINEFEKLVENKETVRMCIVYQNYNLEHIFTASKQLISLSHIEEKIIVSEIYNVITNCKYIDIENMFDDYMKNVLLYDEEKLLLLCMLECIPEIKLTNNSYHNLEIMIKLMRYIHVVEIILPRLMIIIDTSK